jgi:hypothetical protein
MDCHPEHDRDYYWNTSDLSPDHRTLYMAISRDKFKETNRFFHVTGASTTLATSTTQASSIPTTIPPAAIPIRPNEKVEQVAIYLKKRFQEYWIPHRDVAVDECIQGFSGRSKDTVIIRLKPVSEGYKIWIIADNGYVVGFLWHQPGSGKNEGP